MRSRVEHIYQQVGDEVDAIVFMNAVEPNIDLSFFYVSGAESGIFEGCAAILWPDGGLELIVSELEETSARKLDADVKTFRTKDERSKLLKESLAHVKMLGITPTIYLQVYSR